MQQVHRIERRIGQPLHDRQRIAHVKPDVVQPAVADMAQRSDHPIQERLASDEARIRPCDRLAGEMLPRAEADFQPQRTIVVEQPRRIQRPLLRHRHLRQQVVDERGLALAQLMALCPAIKPADLGWIVHRAGG